MYAELHAAAHDAAEIIRSQLLAALDAASVAADPETGRVIVAMRKNVGEDELGPDAAFDDTPWVALREAVPTNLKVG